MWYDGDKTWLFCLCWLSSNPAYSLCDIFAEMLIFICKFAFCSLLINFVVSLNISPVCQKAYSANSSCRHTFSDNKIISLFTKYFNKFRFQSECPIHTPASEVGEQSGLADLLIPFVRLFSLGQHGVITTLYKSKIWQHIFFYLWLEQPWLWHLKLKHIMLKNPHIWEFYTYFIHGLFFVEAFKFIALSITIPWFGTHSVFRKFLNFWFSKVSGH